LGFGFFLLSSGFRVEVCRVLLFSRLGAGREEVRESRGGERQGEGREEEEERMEEGGGIREEGGRRREQCQGGGRRDALSPIQTHIDSRKLYIHTYTTILRCTHKHTTTLCTHTHTLHTLYTHTYTHTL